MRPRLRLARLPTYRHGLRWSVLALTVALSIAGALVLERGARDDARAAFKAVAIEHAGEIELRVRVYADVLYALRGLFDASGSVSREGFQRFAEALSLGQRYPGLTEISFSLLVPHEDKAAFEKAVRAQQGAGVNGSPQFTIRPAGERPQYLVLHYIEPMGKNVAAWGLDLLSDPQRRLAVDRARDSGEIGSISGVPLPRDGNTATPATTGTLLRLAVYRGGGVPKDADERRRLWLGVVGSTLRVSELIESTLSAQTLARSRVRIFAGAAGAGRGGAATAAQLLYDSDPKGAADLSGYAVEQQVAVGDHPWRVLITPRADPISGAEKLTLVAALLGMLTLAALLFWLMHSLTTVQLRSSELARRNKEAALIAWFGEDLHACLTLEEAYAVLSRQMPELLAGVAGGVLYLFDATQTRARAAVRWGSPRAVTEEIAPHDCQALRRGQPFGVEHSQNALNCAHFDGAPPPAYVCVPVGPPGEPIGLLHVQTGSDADPALTAGAAGTILLQVVAQHLALALANLRQKEMLLDQATRDKLTGLYNRHYMTAWFDHEIHRAQRHRRSIGVVMIDIDHFKRINDSFGHDAGDTVLRALADLLRRVARRSDVACRHGGEEFLLLMPEASLEAARNRAEELRQAVALMRPVYEGRSMGPITVSAGVAIYPAHADSAGAMLRLADQALYAAKEGGRNRVVVSGGAGGTDGLPGGP